MGGAAALPPLHPTPPSLSLSHRGVVRHRFRHVPAPARRRGRARGGRCGRGHGRRARCSHRRLRVRPGGAAGARRRRRRVAQPTLGPHANPPHTPRPPPALSPPRAAARAGPPRVGPPRRPPRPRARAKRRAAAQLAAAAKREWGWRPAQGGCDGITRRLVVARVPPLRAGGCAPRGRRPPHSRPRRRPPAPLSLSLLPLHGQGQSHHRGPRRGRGHRPPEGDPPPRHVALAPAAQELLDPQRAHGALHADSVGVDPAGAPDHRSEESVLFPFSFSFVFRPHPPTLPPSTLQTMSGTASSTWTNPPTLPRTRSSPGSAASCASTRQATRARSTPRSPGT